MKIFGLYEWKLIKLILLFVFYGSGTFSMELIVDVSRHTVALRPTDALPLFQPKTSSEEGKLWSELVPGYLVITPDEQGVIVSDPGRVRHFHFNTGKSDVIIKHQCIKKTPLIAVAQQDKALLVASACNYFSKQDRKCVAEYAVYSRGFCNFAQMDSPIQAISLNSSGDLLAIANLSSVTLINLRTKESKKTFFKRERLDGTHWLVDIAMNARGSDIVIAGSRGDIQLMSCNQEVSDLSNDKQVKTGDKIKKIYYPCSGDSHAEDPFMKYGGILYLTDQGKAKIVRVSELNEKDLDQQVDTGSFAKSLEFDKVSADLGDQIAVAYWTDDIKIDQKIRKKIKIYRKDCKGNMDEFTLKLPDMEESYNYRTLSGTLDAGVGRLLHVALRGRTVIALATDGKLRLWLLPEKNKPSTESVIKKEVSPRGRSNSVKGPLMSSGGEDHDRLPAKTKSAAKSKPFMSFISSREHSPTLVKSTPTLPTHHSESTGHHEKDVKHG